MSKNSLESSLDLKFTRSDRQAFQTVLFQVKVKIPWFHHGPNIYLSILLSLDWFLNKRLTKKIQTAQNKCVRFCLNLNNRAHIGIKEFKYINWLPTKERFEQFTTTKVFKFFDKSAPSYMSEMFLPVGQSRATQRSKNKLDQPFRKSKTGQNGLSYLGPKIWNSLHSDLKSAKNANSFKHKIKENSLKTSKIKKTAPMYITEIPKGTNITNLHHYFLP